MLHILSFSWSLGPGFFWVNVLHRLCSCKRFSIAIFDPSNRFVWCVMLRSLTRFFFLVFFQHFVMPIHVCWPLCCLLPFIYLFMYPFLSHELVFIIGCIYVVKLCGKVAVANSSCMFSSFWGFFFRVLLRNSSCFFYIVWPNR